MTQLLNLTDDLTDKLIASDDRDYLDSPNKNGNLFSYFDSLKNQGNS
jgi:hypothetical protein